MKQRFKKTMKMEQKIQYNKKQASQKLNNEIIIWQLSTMHIGPKQTAATDPIKIAMLFITHKFPYCTSDGFWTFRWSTNAVSHWTHMLKYSDWYFMLNYHYKIQQRFIQHIKNKNSNVSFNGKKQWLKSIFLNPHYTYTYLMQVFIPLLLLYIKVCNEGNTCVLYSVFGCFYIFDFYFYFWSFCL